MTPSYREDYPASDAIPLFPDSGRSRASSDLRHRGTRKSAPWLSPGRLRHAPTFSGGSWIRFVAIVAAALLLSLVSFVAGGRHARSSSLSVSNIDFHSETAETNTRPPEHDLSGIHMVKSNGMRIIGVVFYGRPRYVDILDCYLRRNLAVNGGYLDEVHFVIHTNEVADVDWLSDLIMSASLEQYYKILYGSNRNITEFGFDKVWGEFLNDSNTTYVKLDDDIVYIHENAIPHLVNTLITHPEAHSIQANTINGKRTHWFHFHAGAVLPYLPDYDPVVIDPENVTWPTSSLPQYPDKLMLNTALKMAEEAFQPPPSPKHRWLPLDPTTSNLRRTPMSMIPYPRKEEGMTVNWATAAQAHYSFLDNLEHGRLAAYDFGGGGTTGDGTWNIWFGHWNINFMAIHGATVAKNPFWKWRNPYSDEWLLTQVVPARMDMPVLVDTKALVAHFSFADAEQQLLRTDLLDRYRALANEVACAPNNQKFAFEP